MSTLRHGKGIRNALQRRWCGWLHRGRRHVFRVPGSVIAGGSVAIGYDVGRAISRLPERSSASTSASLNNRLVGLVSFRDRAKGRVRLMA